MNSIAFVFNNRRGVCVCVCVDMVDMSSVSGDKGDKVPIRTGGCVAQMEL